MRPQIQTNYKEWTRAMRLWRRAKRRPAEADVVNHFAGQTIFWAINKTPIARKSAWALADRWIPGGNVGKSRSKAARKKDRLFYALASKAGVRRGGGRMQKKAERIWRKRRSGRGVMKAGHVIPLNELGLRAKAQINKLGGPPMNSWAKKATTLNTIATVRNAVPGSGFVVHPAVVTAMGIVAARETKWASERLQKAGNKFNVTPKRSR